MEPVKIAENVYWVGEIDWDLRNFHGYLTQRGSSYNSYLIIDKKITLIDTVKHYLTDYWLDRISKIVNPAKIDYIISNHVEMDHSGGLPAIMKYAVNAEIITSPNGEKGLNAHYKQNWKFRVVNTGATLNIGKRNLQFVLTPMVHWPDNMVTYSPEDKILFSNDAFGQHIASSERLDSEYPLETIMLEAEKYYANIVMPYGAQVTKALESASALDMNIIAPSHGLIWKNHIPEIIERYKKWSSGGIDNKAVIVYDTMWGSTKKIAYAIWNAFEKKGIKVSLYNLQQNHISDIITDILTAKYVCVGSPTLNNNILPSVSAFMTYLTGLSPKNKIGLAFGSFGWGGQSIGILEKNLKEIKFDMLESIKYKYIPDENYLIETEKKVYDEIL